MDLHEDSCACGASLHEDECRDTLYLKFSVISEFLRRPMQSKSCVDWM